MPASTRGIRRDNLRFVLVNNVLAYGWNSPDLSAVPGVSQADLSTGLGHRTEAEVFQGLVKVLGANSPKPARVTKKLANASIGTRSSISTFCAYDKFPQARAAGFSVTKRARSASARPLKPNSRTFTGLMVLSNGLWFSRPIDVIAATPEVRDVLGILDASGLTIAGRKLMVTGSRSKPGMAEVPLAGSNETALLPFSTPRLNNVIDAGYTVKSEEFLTFPGSSGPPF